MASEVTVELTGPLFEHGIDEKEQAAIQRGLYKAAALGQSLVREQLHPGHGFVTGRLWQSVTAGAGTWNEGVVQSVLDYAGWIESGGSRRGRATRFQGYHMFANAEKQLNDGRVLPLIEAELMKVLNG